MTTLKNELLNAINNMDLEERLTLWNEYCLEFKNGEDIIYTMEEFKEQILPSYDPETALEMAFYGNYNPTDDYITFNGYGNFDSFNSFTLAYRFANFFSEDMATEIELQYNRNGEITGYYELDEILERED